MLLFSPLLTLRASRDPHGIYVLLVERAINIDVSTLDNVISFLQMVLSVLELIHVIVCGRCHPLQMVPSTYSFHF